MCATVSRALDDARSDPGGRCSQLSAVSRAALAAAFTLDPRRRDVAGAGRRSRPRQRHSGVEDAPAGGRAGQLRLRPRGRSRCSPPSPRRACLPAVKDSSSTLYRVASGAELLLYLTARPNSKVFSFDSARTDDRIIAVLFPRAAGEPTSTYGKPGRFIVTVCLPRPPTTNRVLPSSPPKAMFVPAGKRAMVWFCGLTIAPPWV
jgi:hypothetical protein